MINTVELHNFKSHHDTKISFDDSRLHALVGQNSSGKTSVLQALYYLTHVNNYSNNFFDQVFVRHCSPDYIATVGQESMSVGSTGCSVISEKLINWHVHFDFNKLRLDGHWQSRCGFEWKHISEDIYDSIKYGNISSNLPQDFKFAVHLKLAAPNLAKATYSEEIVPQMEFDGTGLAPTLDYLRNEAPENFQVLQDKLKRVVPGVIKIGIRRAKVVINRQQVIAVKGKTIPYDEPQEMVGQEVILDMNTGERIPGHALSEGTILTLGLLTVLQNPKKPSLLLLDDVEQGLHPKAQRDLMTVFKEIIHDNPELQIIFSTHSPYIVDELEPSQVHVLSNNNAGFTRCKRLDEHPDIEWAKKTLTTGEFWGAEGEDWVASGEVGD